MQCCCSPAWGGSGNAVAGAFGDRVCVGVGVWVLSELALLDKNSLNAV